MLNPKYTVYHSSVLDAAPETVWAEVRDIIQMLDIVFGNNIKNPHWVKGGSAQKVPSMFEFTLLPGGDVVREEVIGRAEHERSLTYRSIGQVLSIVDYVATYRVLPVTNDPACSFIEWSREFRVVEDADPEFLPFLEGLIDQEIDAVKAHFAT
ncbi:MAG: SRPBCC family protein [Pseudonocardiaceae bacterium]